MNEWNTNSNLTLNECQGWEFRWAKPSNETIDAFKTEISNTYV